MLFVDDSIVRGTTSREIVEMARRRCAQGLFRVGGAAGNAFPMSMVSTCRRAANIATDRSDEEIAREIGADAPVYQDINR